MEILILNGPNLNLVGLREPHIYGEKTMDEVIGELRLKYPQLILHYYQSNHEGTLIDLLQEFGFTIDGIILNPGGYTHTSIALGDTVAAISSPLVEVHISDITNREPFRQHSFVSKHAQHAVIGEGVSGYEIALKYLLADR